MILLENIRRLFGFKNLEEKLQECVALIEQEDLLKSEIDELADVNFETTRSYQANIQDPENKDVVGDIVERHEAFIKSQTRRVLETNKKRKQVIAKKESLLSDEDIRKAYTEYQKCQAYDTLKKAYKNKSISREQYDTVLKATTEGNQVKYADVVVSDRNGKMLFLQRCSDSDFAPDKWGLPGGHVDRGEEAIDAAPRELQEETGLIINGCSEIGIYDSKEAYISYYEARLDEEEPMVVLHSEEHQYYKWMYWEEAKELDMISNLKDNLQKILYPYEEKQEAVTTIMKAYLEEQISTDLLIKALTGQDKMAYVMGEFKDGKLKTKDGKIVTDRKQALAIAMSEAGLSKSEESDTEEQDVENDEDKALETVEKAFKDGLISEDVLLKARSGVYADTAENRKLKRVGQKYGTGKQADTQSGTKTSKEGKNTSDKTPKDKSLDEHAKEASEAALKQTIANSPNEDERATAHAELDRREKEEKPQEEEKTGKVPKKDNTDNQEVSSKNTGETKNDKKDESKKSAQEEFDFENMSLESHTELYKKLSKEALLAMNAGDIDKFNELSDKISEVSKKRSEIIQKDKYKKGEENTKKLNDLGVSKDEIDSIVNYTGKGYREINNALRKGSLTDEQRTTVDNINNALDKLPINKGKVYRGMSVPADIDEILKGWKKGGIISMDSFTSTSESEKVAASFGAIRMEMNSKTGRDIQSISSYGEGEKEVLFKTGAKFKIKSIKINKYKDPFLGEQILSINLKLDEV